MIDILEKVTYKVEFLGLIPKKDELNRQVGEMYYRCKFKDDDKERYCIIKIPKVILDFVDITIDRGYNGYPCVSYDSYLKLRIEPQNDIFYEAIMEDENMNFERLILDEFKDIKFTYQLPKFDHKQIKDVIFNDPATIVFWKDGTKTVVKCQKDKGDTYNPELGLAMCIIKKMSGNKGNYNDVFNKWLPDENK